MSPKNTSLSRLVSVLFVLSIPLLIAGCTQPDHTSRVSDDWSRGRRIGSSRTSDPPAMALSPSGERLLLAWPTQPQEQGPRVIQIQALDTHTGEVAEAWTLPAPANQPTKLELVPGGKEGLHLLWLDGPYKQRILYNLHLDPSGAPAAEALPLSPEDAAVRSFETAPLSDGGLMVLWSARAGLSLARLDAAGHIMEPPLLIPAVQSAGLAVDLQETVHLAWLESISPVHLQVHYAAMPLNELTPPISRPLASILLSRGQTERNIEGPIVATENDHVYVIWTQTVVTLLETTEEAYYVQTDKGQVQDTQNISFAGYFPPDYVPSKQVPGLSKLALPFQSNVGGASLHGVPRPVKAWQEQCLLAISLQCHSRSRDILQPALAVLKEGKMLGYTIVGWTNRPSVGVTSTVDEQGRLYVAWVDTVGRSEDPIYLATTSAALKPAFNRLTFNDVLAGFVENSTRAVQGIVFFPLALLWAVFPMAGLVIALWWHRGDLSKRATAPVFGTAIALHLASKYLLTRDLLVMVPRLAFIPPGLSPVFIYGLPLGSMAVGVAIAYLFYIRRQKEDWTPIPAYLIVFLCDMLISLSMYGIANYE